MIEQLFSRQRPVLSFMAVALVALCGWGAFAYSALSVSGKLGAVTAERDTLKASYELLQQASGDLEQVRGRLMSARLEHSQTVQGWAEARAKVGAAQQELAALAKRVQQARDVAQTGSIRPAEPPKRPAGR
jgi:CHASE3 domain sensor protein